jgi:predicted KAP-like P-loop ATPase
MTLDKSVIGLRFQNLLRPVVEGRKKWILLIVLVVLVAFRIALPYIVKSYVNKTLADIPGYPDTLMTSIWISGAGRM